MNEPDFPRPRFTGIFIPVEILELECISYFEMILLSWVDALFCKDHGGCFASNEYLATKLKVKENTIAKSLTKLRKLGLIEDVSFDGRQRVIRAKIHEVIREGQSNTGLDKNPRGVGQKSNATLDKCPTPSYIDSKEESKEERVSQAADASVRLARLLLDLMKKRDPKLKEPDLTAWQQDIDKLMRIDGRSEDEIEQVIRWAHEDNFWYKNVRSGSKLRKQFDRLYVEMLASKKSPKNQADAEAKEKADRIRANQQWAKQYFKEGDIVSGRNRMTLKENGVEVKINGAYKIIGFLEYGFAEQVQSAHMKIRR